MACAACQQQRMQLMNAMRQGNALLMAQAIMRGARIAADKAVGVDVDKKYLTPAQRLYGGMPVRRR